MVTSPDGDSRLIEDGADVVRVHAVDDEGRDRRLPLSRADEAQNDDVIDDIEDARSAFELLGYLDGIGSKDYDGLGLTPAGANRALDRLVPDALVRGSATGRNAHYVPN